MSKIHVGQTKLDIEVYLGQDITGQQEAIIKYVKPDNTTGSFTATVIDETVGHIRYEVANASDLDQSGDWTFWGHITYTDGKVIAGEARKEKIYAEGT